MNNLLTHLYSLFCFCISLPTDGRLFLKTTVMYWCDEAEDLGKLSYEDLRDVIWIVPSPRGFLVTKTGQSYDRGSMEVTEFVPLPKGGPRQNVELGFFFSSINNISWQIKDGVKHVNCSEGNNLSTVNCTMRYTWWLYLQKKKIHSTEDFYTVFKTSEKALKKKFRSRGFCFVMKNVKTLMSYVKIPSLEKKKTASENVNLNICWSVVMTNLCFKCFLN